MIQSVIPDGCDKYASLTYFRTNTVRFPPAALREFARVFNNSTHAKYLIVSVSHREVMDTYKFYVEYVSQTRISLNGTTTRTMYIYSRKRHAPITDSAGILSNQDRVLSNTITSILSKEEGLVHKMWREINNHGDVPKRKSRARSFLTYRHGRGDTYMQEEEERVEKND